MKARILIAALALASGLVWAGARGEAGRQEALARACEAFETGDYAAMARAYEPLAEAALAQFDAAAGDAGRLEKLLDTRLDDVLGPGHAHQLAGDWPKAVGAYQAALHLVALAAKARQAADPPPPDGLLTPRDLAWYGSRQPKEYRALAERHAFLALRIGLMQRDGQRDRDGAAATFARGIEFSPAFQRPAAKLAADRMAVLRLYLAKDKEFKSGYGLNPGFRIPYQCLCELALTQEKMGRVAAAIEAQNRVNLTWLPACMIGRKVDLAAMGRLIQEFPADQPLPPTALVRVLSPQAPGQRFDTQAPETLAECYTLTRREGAVSFHFALSPSAGREFAALEFTCEAERGAGGVLGCWAGADEGAVGKVEIGSLGWPEGQPAGRRVLAQRFPVPPGAGMVFFAVMQSEERLNVHSVEVKAEFRPRQDAAPPAPAWVQAEAVPPGGRFLRNGEPAPADRSSTPLPAGRYSFQYLFPGRPHWVQNDVDLLGGRRYAFFVNLASPFRWRLTNLRGFLPSGPYRSSLVRLPDGRWLAAYVSKDSKVAVSTSTDLLRWEEPAGLPHEAAFESVDPALYLARGGTAWLAYFSNRLQTDPAAGQGHRLWLTSTRDGRTWAPPRPIRLTAEWGPGTPCWRDFQGHSGSQIGPVQILENPPGRCWVSWRGCMGTADSPGRVRRLERIKFEGKAEFHPYDPHIAVDAGGRFRMATTGTWRGVFHSASRDGWAWSAPVPLVDREQGDGPVESPQLFLDGGRAALLYEDNHGCGWLRRGRIEPNPDFEPDIQVTNWLTRLEGAVACLTPDGRVTLLIGGDTVWVLQAPLTHLTRELTEF